MNRLKFYLLTNLIKVYKFDPDSQYAVVFQEYLTSKQFDLLKSEMKKAGLRKSIIANQGIISQVVETKRHPK